MTESSGRDDEGIVTGAIHLDVAVDGFVTIALFDNGYGCSIANKGIAVMIFFGDFTAEELDAIEQKARADADAAAEFAISSPEPDPAGLMDDVFYEEAL